MKKAVICIYTAAFIALLCFNPKSANADIIGIPSVIDGDTIEIHGQRIRLEGIDSPESKQICYKDLKPWMCGKEAAWKLNDLISNRTVTCKDNGRDRYKRIIAVCYLSDLDINSWMVEQGWALAYRKYSKNYIHQEEIAEQSKSGIWSSEFVAPWEYRKVQRK